MFVCEKDSKSSIRYYIDEEHGIVTAVIDNCEDDIYHDMGENFPLYLVRMDGFESRYKLRKTYKGKAEKAEDDEWDVEAGKRYARSRALFKYHLSRLKTMNKLMEDLSKFDNKLQKIMENAYLGVEKAVPYLGSKTIEKIKNHSF